MRDKRTVIHGFVHLLLDELLIASFLTVCPNRGFHASFFVSLIFHMKTKVPSQSEVANLIYRKETCFRIW